MPILQAGVGAVAQNDFTAREAVHAAVKQAVNRYAEVSTFGALVSHLRIVAMKLTNSGAAQKLKTLKFF